MNQQHNKQEFRQNKVAHTGKKPFSIPPLQVSLLENLQEFVMPMLLPEPERAGREYLALSRLAVAMRASLLMRWGHQPSVLENGANSFLLIADFIIHMNADGSFRMHYQHVHNELVLAERSEGVQILWMLEKLAAANEDRYKPRRKQLGSSPAADDLPF